MMPPAPRSGPEAATAITLFGRDHAASGQSVTAGVAGRAAIGLARGWMPKPYPYVDPNEDAAGCSVDARACLLVVADGHNGHEASHAALEVVMDLLGHGPIPARLADGDVLDVAAAIEARIGAVNARGGPRSRTTLVVALRTATHLQWLAAGDSALLLVAVDDHEQLPSATRWFFGDGLGRSALRRALVRERIGVPPDRRVVLATDGYTDYLPAGLAPPAAAARALAHADGVDGAAGALLDQARRGGAGDNVGVAVSGPW